MMVALCGCEVAAGPQVIHRCAEAQRIRDKVVVGGAYSREWDNFLIEHLNTAFEDAGMGSPVPLVEDKR